MQAYEHILEGFEDIPSAFLSMMEGESQVNLSYDGGGPYVPPQSVFIFLLKISPPDQTFIPSCKFLFLGLLSHEFFFFLYF